MAVSCFVHVDLLPAFRRLTLWIVGGGRSTAVLGMATVGNIGAYCVSGEKPDNQAETGCTHCERNPLVSHSHRMTAFAHPMMSSRPEGIVMAKRRSDTPSAGRT